jgi:peptidoglycan/xylan/chitin deacetylase (PgdA/CDA1 family)
MGYPFVKRSQVAMLATMILFLWALGFGACGAQGAPRPAAPTPSHDRSAQQALPPPPLSHVPTDKPWVALTYDDGPGEGAYSTPAILELLRRSGDQATFFVLGDEVRRHPQVVRQEVEAGMEVESHGDRHLNLAHLSPAQQDRHLRLASQAIQEAGAPAPRFLRPPYGAHSLSLRRTAQRLGLRVVLWDVDPRDWANPGTGAIVRFVLAHVHPGAIILLHDGGGKRWQTVEATRLILSALHRRGYRLVTLAALVAKAPPPASEAVRRVHPQHERHPQARHSLGAAGGRQVLAHLPQTLQKRL